MTCRYPTPCLWNRLPHLSMVILTIAPLISFVPQHANPTLPLPARPNLHSTYYSCMSGNYATTPNMRYQNTTIPRTKPPAVTNWLPERYVCYKCLNYGHFPRDCRNTPVYPFHNVYGRPWYQCKDHAEHRVPKQMQTNLGNNPHTTNKSCHFIEDLPDTRLEDPSPVGEVIQSPWDPVLYK